ncbi:MAG: hypothetical protein EBR26_06135 [Microbacteriaceae bacterium]|nr:hypothetical protein [Microbacteriaceae bacterium]
MQTGESDQAALVKTMRRLSYSKLDKSFLLGEGSNKPGYDRYGKYKIRFGWGIALGLTAITSIWIYRSFFPKHADDFYDPELVWTRSNSYWLVPLVLLSWLLVKKWDDKDVEEDFGNIEKSITKSGINILSEDTVFSGATVFSTIPDWVVPGRSFGVFAKGQIQVAFGETFQRWDQTVKPMTTLHGAAGPFPSLFMYVAMTWLETPVVHLYPKTPIDWDSLPSMNQKAKDALSRLASRYLVVLGGGGLVIGLAEESNNSFETSLTGTMNTPTGWRICLDIISGQLADIVEGLT